MPRQDKILLHVAGLIQFAGAVVVGKLIAKLIPEAHVWALALLPFFVSSLLLGLNGFMLMVFSNSSLRWLSVLVMSLMAAPVIFLFIYCMLEFSGSIADLFTGGFTALKTLKHGLYLVLTTLLGVSLYWPFEHLPRS